MNRATVERGLSVATTALACAWTVRVIVATDVRVVLIAVTALAALIGPRITLSTFAQRVLSLVCAALALTVRRTMLSPAQLPFNWLGGIFADLSLAAIFIMSARLTLREPEWGPQVSIALGFAALLSDGQVRVGPMYGLVVTAFLFSGTAWTHVHDPTRPPLGAALRARAPQWISAGVITVLLATAGARALPKLHDLLLVYVGERYRGEVASSGFNDRMTLDALDGMLLSDEIALRIYGPADDYLRGAVFNQYLAGRWSVSGSTHEHVIHAIDRPDAGGARVEIRRVAASEGWYFAPMRATAMATPRGELSAGRFGMLHPAQGDDGAVFSYRAGPRTAAAIDPPDASDLQLPRVRARLTPFVARWTSPTDPPFVRAARITLHLSQEYGYSLSTPRSPRLDPVVDFLTLHKQGHCEYFASALALLCREAGVPARVVAGYRVFERSPLGGHAIVRERNAHAWVEVWTDGAWHTLDATPGSAIRPHRSAWSRRYQTAVDVVGLGVERGRAWVSARTPLQTAGMISLGVVWIALGRALRARRARGATAARGGVTDAPLDCWVRLEASLAQRGFTRAPHETLESFAARLRDDAALGALGPRVADAIEGYAALRYGGVGETDGVAASLEALAREIDARPTAV